MPAGALPAAIQRDAIGRLVFGGAPWSRMGGDGDAGAGISADIVVRLPAGARADLHVEF